MVLEIFLVVVVYHASASAATLTHGPMVGHTTDRATRIWVRADRVCDFQVRVTPTEGHGEVLSEIVRLNEADNFCGSASVTGLSPSVLYEYMVILSGQDQVPDLAQSVRTFPPKGKPSVLNIGIGHSLRGKAEDPQTIWLPIADRKPDLFILMGDNIYSNSTEPEKQRRMYLEYRADPHFRALAATVPIYAIWDDHDYGKNNSDRTQPGKERSLKTFNEVWANPPSQARVSPGIWTRFSIGEAEFFLLDVRYHRSPNKDLDGPEKTMLGPEQLEWLVQSLHESTAKFKFIVSGSSWNCGGAEAWNHKFLYEYDALLSKIREDRVEGVILLGGDQHSRKIAVRQGESWDGYDLHEWMAGQLFPPAGVANHAFGMIELNTIAEMPKAKLAFVGLDGNPRNGKRVLYTAPGALRALFESPPGVTGKWDKPVTGEFGDRVGVLWDALPDTKGETLTLDDLDWSPEAAR